LRERPQGHSGHSGSGAPLLTTPVGLVACKNGAEWEIRILFH
jgi:hypothetical protein